MNDFVELLNAKTESCCLNSNRELLHIKVKSISVKYKVAAEGEKNVDF